MNDGSIAIVGASCRFPGAPNLDAFWELLTAGRDAVTEVDAQRWSTRFFYHPTHGEPARSYTWSAGLIDGVDQFEPAFFGISPREAAQMDPQQRILLELAWHATEDAGIPTANLAGEQIGVYVGASSTDYRDLRLGDPASGDSYFMTGGTLSILANRISHVFDLRGPSLAVDTACSSSLVALHHACEAIRGGRIAGAIVGGINLLLAPYPFLGFCRASMLSRRGRCFAFDARADGYVRGEGGAAVILKPLRAALRDGDRIRAVIRGTGVNSDGHTIGLSLPSEAAQTELIRAVCAQAAISPDDLAFFEMHGTGTPAGDPIEAAAVGRALGQQRRSALPIGSVKTNVGHLEPASGMAGLIKAALALEHGVLPPTLNCESPNPDIPFEVLNLRLVQRPEPIEPSGCAGVNSFGFGGTNAHAVLAPPPSRIEDPAAADGAALPPLLLSAGTEASLRELAQRWEAALAAAPARRLPAMLRAAARRRDQHAERLVAWGEDRAAIAMALADFAGGTEHPALVSGTAVRDGKLAFVFAGNGAQWPGMGRSAYEHSAAFRAALAEADAVLRPLLGWSVAEAVADGVDADRLARADIAQPLLFAIQVGVVSALRGLGVAASGHIGHSVGEIGAAWASGALSLADAAHVVAARSRQQERTRGIGRMAALALGEPAAAELLGEIDERLEIGAINATQSVTVSGPSEAIERLADEARRRGIACRPLDLDFAFHSAAMDPIRDGLLEDLTGLRSAAPDALLISTVTGGAVAAGDLDNRYWWRNIRHPVRFADGMAALVGEGYRIFLEIGPHPVLQAYLHDGLRAAQQQGRALATLARKQEDGDPFAAIAARSHVAGCDIARSERFDGPADPSQLPLYPWQRERFWFDRTVEDIHAVDPPLDHPLLGFRQHGPVASWHNHIDPALVPWLADHAVEGVPVLPAAAVLEMALAAARLHRPDAGAVEVADVELRRPLPFDNGRAREISCVVTGEEGDWELRSRTRLADEPLALHAVARFVSAADRQVPPPAVGEPSALAGSLDAAALYRTAARLGLDYGPSFRTVRRVDLLSDGSAVTQLDPSVIPRPADDFLIHPALLDGALQGLLAIIAGRSADLADVTFLPWRFGRVRLDAPFGRDVCQAKLRLTRLGTRSASADIDLFDAAGLLIGELSECWFRRVELTRRLGAEEGAVRTDLVPAPLVDSAPPEVLDKVGEIVAGLTRNRHLGTEERAEQALLLDALVASVALDAVPAAIERDAPFSLDDLVDAGTIAPEAAPLLASLLHVLERFGAANAAGSVWRLTPENDLPDAADIWRSLLADAPELVAELALVAAAAAELPEYLTRGSPRPEAALGPMVENLLHGSPVGAGIIDLLCGTLGRIAKNWPPGRPLRILEIGALGVLTRRLLDRLTQSGVALHYVATHPEPEQAARLGFAIAGIAGARACCWSPLDPGGDLDTERFDIIVSTYAGARAGIDVTLPALAERLAPGGLLLAVEPAPNPLWHLIFGRDVGWWAACGRGREASPLRTAAEWRDALSDGGLDAVHAVALTGGAWPCSLFWGSVPATGVADARAASPRRVYLVAADSADGASLGELLAATGCDVRLVDGPALASQAEDDPDATNAEDDAVVLWLLGNGDPGCSQTGSAARLAAMAPRLAAAAARRQMPLWLVTIGAQQSDGSGAAGLAGAALWGLGRVLSNEIPRLQLRLIDLAPAMAVSERAAALAGELTSADRDTEIVWTATGRYVLRLRRGLPARWAAKGEMLALTGTPQSGAEASGWQPAAPRPPGPGEVAVDVHAAGLNFRDVMWAMGLVPEEALIDGFTGPSFGLECAGIVCEVGVGVTRLSPGDRVAGFAPASFATRVTTAAHAMTRIPDDMSFAAAATLPVTFVTAAYALGTLAHLAAGEVVLVHAASGGVGLAAIQYAKHRGAVVIATAGSETKRAFLRLAGADHVLNSRDLGFAEAVREITAGRGVDIVLNSLSGEAMEQSLSVLKPFGRFLELGKRDFYLNRRVHLRPLRQNISYFAIDVDQLPVQRPDLAQSLLSEIGDALKGGAIRPLAHRMFDYAAVGEAFRVMQASAHIGKLVLVPNGNAGVRLRRTGDCALRGDGTYLVTGGIGGFGFAAARWLAQHGAGAIALLGRRGGETPGAAEAVTELRSLGADTRIYAADVADRGSLEAALADIRKAQPPLRGIIHAASVIADGVVAELDEAAFAAALRPKLDGAMLLDRLTRDDPLDLFILFSSATTLLGAPGQGAYVAANAALEALARQRRASRRPALAIAWGPIEDVGYLAERPAQREALVRRLGAKTMTASQALAALPVLLGSGLPAVVYADASWSEARRHLPILAAPLFADLCAEAESASGDDSLIERLAGLGPEEAKALLQAAVAEEAATILRMPAAGLDPLRPLSEFGMDSLMAVELRLALESRLRIDLPLMSLTEGTSVASIATRLAGAILRPQHASEIVNLAERYEAADSGRLGSVTSAVEPFDAVPVDSAAAE